MEKEKLVNILKKLEQSDLEKLKNKINNLLKEDLLNSDESERERLAQRILDLIQDCETEEEMLQNLRRLL